MTGALLVACAGSELALAVEDVLEVVRTVAMAKPAVDLAHAFGWFDWRGRLVPAFDLAARRGLAPPRSLADYVDGHLVITHDAAGPIGWAVDRARLSTSAVELPVERVASWLEDDERRRVSLRAGGGA